MRKTIREFGTALAMLFAMVAWITLPMTLGGIIGYIVWLAA